MFFSKHDHKYYKKFLEKDSNLISVSTVVKMYESEFDEFYWSLYKAYEYLLYKTLQDSSYDLEEFINKKLTNSKQFFKTYTKQYKSGDYKVFNYLKMFIDEEDAKLVQEEILYLWELKNKKSLTKGHDKHDYEEQKALTSAYSINPFDNREYPIIQSYEWIDDNTKKSIVDLSNLETGYYPEIILTRDIIVGQSDKIWIDNDDVLGKSFYIDDWKTNEKIVFSNKHQKMKYPVNHLDNCNWNHYRLQLSLYIWILKQYGYECKGARLTHCLHDTETDTWQKIPYEFEYMEEEVNAIIRDLKLKML